MASFLTFQLPSVGHQWNDAFLTDLILACRSHFFLWFFPYLILDFSFSFQYFLFFVFFSNPGGVLAGFETRDIGRQWNNGGKVGLSSLQPLLLPG